MFDASLYKPINQEAPERIRIVKSIARKSGLRVSYCMVYGGIDQLDVLSVSREQILQILPDLVTSPVSWMPGEKYGYDICCFGFLPHIENREDCRPSNIIGIDEYPVTFNSLKECHMPMWIHCYRNTVKMYCLAPKRYNYPKLYSLGDDSGYIQNLSSEEFIQKVLSDNNILGDYDEQRGIVITSNMKAGYESFRILRNRINVSCPVGLALNDEEYDTFIFSVDNKRLDYVTGRHELFFWETVDELFP